MNEPAHPTGFAKGTRLLDRYVIDGPVARGGMAVIYKGVDERFQREVCVKLLRTQVEVGDREIYHATYTHFLQEAALLSKLQHPNTLKIFDFGHALVPNGPDGSEEKCPFQVSEFIGGGNLEEHVRKQGKLAPREVLEIIEPLCHALAEAHGHGIIHRDLKPPNILFAEIAGKRIPKLADFGIAKTLLVKRSDADSTITETISKIALFSPRWAAPEQIASTSDGPETDVFGLALMTAFMLGGRPPFSERDVASTLKERIKSDEPVAEAVRSLALPKHVERFLTSVLVLDKKRRPKTSLLFFSLLRSAFAVETSGSIPPPAMPPRPSSFAPEPPAVEKRQAPGFHFGGPQAAPGDSEMSPDTPVVDVPHLGEAPVETPLAFPRPQQLPQAPAHRVIYMNERTDLSFTPQRGTDLVRIRIALLPNDHAHIKGLNCFVAREGQGPTAAVTVGKSETITCISAHGTWLGRMVCAFPTKLTDGFAFALEDGSLLLPYSEGAKAIALKLPDSPEWLIVIQQ